MTASNILAMITSWQEPNGKHVQRLDARHAASLVRRAGGVGRMLRWILLAGASLKAHRLGS